MLQEEEQGTFQQADEETLKKRRIIKPRKPPAGAAPQTANPFAGVSLFGAPAAPITAISEAAKEVSVMFFRELTLST